MSELSEEFRVTIVDAIRTLCLKYPNKGPAMLQFLSSILREEGGYEFKKAVVESMFDLVRYIPQVKDDALGQLAEFIEDCEFTKLAVRILHLLGVEGPKANQPTKYIRAIYNRVVLENAIVRAAAVTALGKFGLIQDKEVRNSVRVLLTRCLDDSDDEVRDRAAFNLKMIDEDEETASRFLRNDSMFSLPILEKQLVMYVTSEADNFATPFDLSKIPVVTREQADAEERSAKLTAATPTIKAPAVGPKPSAKAGAETAATAAAAAQQYADQLQQIPELASYGGVLKSSATVQLTESGTEYVCKAIKHIFKEAVVLEFNISSTLPETVLTDVTVSSTSEDEEGLEEEFVIPAPQLKTNEPGAVYVAFKRVGGESTYAATSFTNVLKFTSHEIDPTTNEPEEQGYDDEYQVEDLDLTGADYVIPAYAGSFDNVWEQAAGDEASETLQLSNIKSISGSYHALPIQGSDVLVAVSSVQTRSILTCLQMPLSSFRKR
jgi:coatomer protein complex subunit gamma